MALIEKSVVIAAALALPPLAVHLAWLGFSALKHADLRLHAGMGRILNRLMQDGNTGITNTPAFNVGLQKMRLNHKWLWPLPDDMGLRVLV